MVFLPACRPSCRGPPRACEWRGGGGALQSTAWTPARLGLSVGCAYRSRETGRGKLWSSPNGESGPAASLVSSVRGGPPSTDWPQVGSTRWVFLDLRLAIVPPGRGCTARAG